MTNAMRTTARTALALGAALSFGIAALPSTAQKRRTRVVHAKHWRTIYRPPAGADR